MSDLSALNSLQAVRSELFVVENPALTSLSGLGSLAEVASLEVFGNDALTSLTGLDSLNTIESI